MNEPERPLGAQPTPGHTLVSEEKLEISDIGITSAVERRLHSDHLTPTFGVKTTTTDGIVELTGTVDNLLARTRAARLAESVKGVRSVSNRITIETETVDDAKLADDPPSVLLLRAAGPRPRIA